MYMYMYVNIHTHTHSLSLSLSLSHTHSLSLSLSLSLSHTHTHTHSLTHARTHSLTHRRCNHVSQQGKAALCYVLEYIIYRNILFHAHTGDAITSVSKAKLLDGGAEAILYSTIAGAIGPRLYIYLCTCIHICIYVYV